MVKLPRLRVESPGGPAGWQSVLDGFRYLRGHPVLMTSFLVDIIAMVFGMPRALFPEAAHVDFGGPESGGLAFALLFAAIPAGAVLGGIFSGWVSRIQRQGLAVIIAIVRVGPGHGRLRDRARVGRRRAGVYLAAAVLMLVIGGAADMASAAFRVSMLQASASDHVRGRLQGIFVVVVAGGPRVADTAHGAAAALVGTAAAAAGGGVLVVVGVWPWRSRSRRSSATGWVPAT